jgi:hypothetical protein
MIDKDELESIHGDDDSVIMEGKNAFSNASSDNESVCDYKKNRRDSRTSNSSQDTSSKRRNTYAQIKQYCRKKQLDFPSHLTPESPYHELKSHMTLLRNEYKMEKSVDMCKKMLVSFASVFEYLNTRFDPFGLHMDGWSENINDNKDEYDEVFEELYEKYQSTIDCPPEIRLIMMIGGSAASYHVMSSMAQKMGLPSSNNKFKESPSQPTSRPNKTPTPVQQVSNPDEDDDEDIQDILNQIKKENNKQQSDDDNESLSSTATSVRRKRTNKSVGLDDL